jgi:hypothetical protein
VLRYQETSSSKTGAGSTGQFACVYMPLAHVCCRLYAHVQHVAVRVHAGGLASDVMEKSA